MILLGPRSVYIWSIDATLIKSVFIYYGLMVYCLNRSCFIVVELSVLLVFGLGLE